MVEQITEARNVNPILGLQPRDKAAMLVVNTKETFLQNLRQNRVHLPAERNAFVLDSQHGRRDVTCKPAIHPENHRPKECMCVNPEVEVINGLSLL